MQIYLGMVHVIGIMNIQHFLMFHRSADNEPDRDMEDKENPKSKRFSTRQIM